MKRYFLLFSLLAVFSGSAFAQLPNGSIAPNFTTTDLDGVSHTLYNYLDAGKTVFIDVSATWCGPCWNYHNTGAFDGIWEQYGPNGTNEAMVLFIEGDASTNTACLYGPSGCQGGTQGNWVAGTDYPICDDASVASLLSISYYPTIYMVCPDDKKIYVVGQLPTSGLWAQKQTKCAPPPVAINLNNVNNVKCFGTASGSIDIGATGGAGAYSYLWSNGATTQDLINVPAGVYTVTVTATGSGQTETSDPIEVEGPSGPIVIELIGSTPFGCAGQTASLSVEASGGWSDYIYTWNNGQGGPEAIGLTPGVYTVTVKDGGLCTKTQSYTVAPAVYPVASIAPPSSISCSNPTIVIDGSASSSGANYSYEWFVSAGGNVVSGGNTPTPTVNGIGNYTLKVKNTDNNCSTNAFTSVSGNVTQPTANAGPTQSVSCSVPSTVLQGSGSTGATYSYLWTASNGGNITGGANTLTPTVNAAGNYTLVVTDSGNGCTKSATTSVTGNNAPPSANTTGGAITCTTNSVVLTTTTNAGTPVFAWTGPNGFTSAEQSPTVSTSGAYNLVVTDNATGCSNTAVASVVLNNTTPSATATGGTMNCTVNSVTINANTDAATPTFAWTGPNGFSSTLQNPTVNQVGAYNVVVTNSANGCASSATANVALNSTTPTAVAAAAGTLNCNASQVQLNGTGSSAGANFTYAWTASNGGNIVSGANTLTPTVNAAGAYSLVVTDSDNNCTAAASTTVVQNSAVNASISASGNVACNGGASGSAAVAGAGGNGAYSYSWSNGATTASVNNLTAGTYVVAVTDGENCSATTSVVITQPDQLLANASATAQTANGVNDGTATANPTGGTASYTYLWNTSSTAQTITGLTPGSYTVSVTDANGCIAVQVVTVNSFNCTLAANINGVNITCNGANNGSASLNLTGAANPITYAWSNGATTESVSNLPAGLITVNITDGNNCPATLSFNITEPSALTANAIATGETATGAADGTASANPTGGTAGYNYLWSNGSTLQTINGLAPGAYTVSVTDANGCQSVQTVSVSAFACAVAASATVVNVNCAGASNGSVSLAITGGTAPYSYEWSNGSTAESLSNLAAGTYTATITDDNDCEHVATAVVTEPTPFSQISVSATGPVCANDPTGSAEVSLSGGTQPYTYLWSNGVNTATVNNLTAGTYGVSISDQNNCTTSTSVVIAATDNVPPSLSVQNANLSLDANGVGSVTIALIGAQFSDNCGVASSSIAPNTFNCSQLGQQVVTMSVTDLSGLTTTATATITVIDDIAPTLTCPSNIVTCKTTVDFNAPVAQDNCLLNGGTWAQTSGLPSGATFPYGNTQQSFTYTDAGGNIGACSFVVTVNTSPEITDVTVTNDQNNQGVGSINISVTNGAAPYSYVWIKEGQTVGTTEDLNNIKEGTYTVEITDANGCLTVRKEIIVSNTTAVKDPTWLSGVRMMPNPTANMVRIQFPTTISEELEITLIDATGRVAIREHFSNALNIELDCSQLPAGYYAVRFSNGFETGVRKLAVQR